ncbi:MAG TPA: hypothetical protein PLS49_00980 [Candidatus Woesebacteria bacterium]|nr:hypothetical protein [Candidatus Woesebacteria bacterium]
MKNPVNEIQIIPVKPKDGLIAFCSFVLFDSLYCSSVGVFTRPSGGYRLVYPTKRVGSRDIDIYYPVTREIGLVIEEEVTKVIQDLMKNGRYSIAHVE